MSEYTSYYAVKSNDVDDVKRILNQAQILSIVDDSGFGLDDEYKPNGHDDWIIIATDAEYTKLQQLPTLFNTMILFNLDEDRSCWDIDVYYNGEGISKRFYPNEPEVIFTEHDKVIFEHVFGKTFLQLQPLLSQDRGKEFLNTVGIPYCEMLDQNIMRIHTLSLPEGQYVLSFDDLDDYYD